MKFSRKGITSILVIILSTFLLSNCAFYNRVKSRQNLVDGAEAYKARKFAVAEDLFRDAIRRDPEGETQEGRTAQVFLARTLHSEYIADRKNQDKAREAIAEYQKVLQKNPADQSSFKAVASLYENLQMQDEWEKWVTERANSENVPDEQRAEALVTLAARKYTCANEISDAEGVKKTVREGDKDVYQFVKPANEQDFQKLKQCTQDGLELVNKAVELAPNSDSAWSYKANLLAQKARIAEMDGNKAEEDQFKAQANEAKEKFTALNEERKKREAEEEARKQAEKQAANQKK
jgi:hypothetical protein